MYTVVFIRDFPDLPIGFRDSYCMYYITNLPNTLSIEEFVKEEINKRGGKYGAIIYSIKNIKEYKKFNQKGEEI